MVFDFGGVKLWTHSMKTQKKKRHRQINRYKRRTQGQASTPDPRGDQHRSTFSRQIDYKLSVKSFSPGPFRLQNCSVSLSSELFISSPNFYFRNKKPPCFVTAFLPRSKRKSACSLFFFFFYWPADESWTSLGHQQGYFLGFFHGHQWPSSPSSMLLFDGICCFPGPHNISIFY